MTSGGGSNSDFSPTASKKKGWPRGKKRRLLPRDANAPKGPLSGYNLFMNNQREIVKQTNSKACFSEVTKIIAQKWAQLDVTEKQKFLEAADVDKERYNREITEYRKSASYKNYIQQHSQETSQVKKPRKEAVVQKDVAQDPPIKNKVAMEIPIFTEEFLNHNKSREGELRQLRKSNVEYEEQNAILQKHIESLRGAVDKLDTETKQQESKQSALMEHLSSLRKSLSQAFTNITIPGTSDPPTEDTVDNFVTRLHSLLSNSPQQHAKLAQSVKVIVNNLHTN